MLVALVGALPWVLACGVGPEAAFEFRLEKQALPASPGPQITLMFVAPVQTDVGAKINLVSDAAGSAYGKVLTFGWTADGGDIAHAGAHETTYTCRVQGPHQVTLTVTDARNRRDALSTTVYCM